MSIDESRRTFLKNGVILCAAGLVGGKATATVFRAAKFRTEEAADLSVVRGDDYYASAVKAVDELGGMKKFVGRGSKVGLLVNSRYNKPGTYVKPEIVIAAVEMCLDAGARKIVSLENVTASYWRLSSFSKGRSEAINEIRYAGNSFKKVAIPAGKKLKEAEIQPDLLDCDTYINIPIFKQHEGVKITGCLKNVMGLTSYGTNDFFHNGSNRGGGYADVPFLSQCIADVNLIRKPDLCIADATEFITSNGPFGPGNVVKAKKIVAGADIVAVDSLGAEILGYLPSEILPIRMAHEHGLGEIDLKKLHIIES